MDRLDQLFGSVDRSIAEYSVQATVLSLLLAFVLGQMVGWVYTRTHSGVSYSRSFTQSIVLMMMVVSLVMTVIGNSIVTAFGLIGALALIRFRNVLKDTRDTVFVFIALVIGMACGSQRYSAAVLGAVALCLVVTYLYVTRFGSLGTFDGHLTCRVAQPLKEGDNFFQTLRRFCFKTREVSERHGGDMVEYVFQVRLRDRKRGSELTEDLRRQLNVRDVALIMRDELAEL